MYDGENAKFSQGVFIFTNIPFNEMIRKITNAIRREENGNSLKSMKSI